jgi:hypothetical protein
MIASSICDKLKYIALESLQEKTIFTERQIFCRVFFSITRQRNKKILGKKSLCRVFYF